MLRRLLPLQTRGYHLVSAAVIIAAGNRVILLNEDQSLSPHSSILIEFFNFGMHDIGGRYHSLCREYLPALSHIANLLRHTRKNFTFTHLYQFFWKCKGKRYIQQGKGQKGRPQQRRLVWLRIGKKMFKCVTTPSSQTNQILPTFFVSY